MVDKSLFVLHLFQYICFGTQPDDVAIEGKGYDFEELVEQIVSV